MSAGSANGGAGEPDLRGGQAVAVAGGDVRLVAGRLADDELAAIAVAVSAMSVASRIEAGERALADEHRGAAGAWSDAAHSFPRSHALRALPSESAWMFSDR
ncbi:hypothetical protein Bra3105_17235 [Brachybacterium halotolerans subsp. kimchii]|uniref:hypothetical protein n=1 Tax=Brachybacterium halotolerans TaxID=2795215 RepID=UPI001E56FC2B|nr:hypothetical protein [Brachybacterium halotolerans]UEJ82549.1 hypothetical protein Bra3105_17235 [Brachybacterium halotolerans subsp. kimchii]